jgi:glutaconate CoA-transferase subunit A
MEINKVTTLRDAVARFVRSAATLGLGGQNIGRCAMAVAHEIVRQGPRDLTLYGCNLSISMDLLVGAGLVRRTESGTGNLERFGTTFCWRRGIEQGTLEVEDWSHLAMVSRFLAGEMGVPFMPVKSLLGSDLLTWTSASGFKKFEVIDNPWNRGEPVVLVPAATPDVAIVHVQRADPMGNVIIEGFATHEPEMVRAARHAIVTCEELVDTDLIRADPERTTIAYPHVSAVVHQPWGAYPTSTYRYYDYDGDEIQRYQAAARAGGDAYRRYLEEHVLGVGTFEEYLARVCPPARRAELEAAMRAML